MPPPFHPPHRSLRATWSSPDERAASNSRSVREPSCEVFFFMFLVTKEQVRLRRIPVAKFYPGRDTMMRNMMRSDTKQEGRVEAGQPVAAGPGC
jgi:hypothetical protein